MRCKAGKTSKGQYAADGGRGKPALSVLDCAKQVGSNRLIVCKVCEAVIYNCYKLRKVCRESTFIMYFWLAFQNTV